MFSSSHSVRMGSWAIVPHLVTAASFVSRYDSSGILWRWVQTLCLCSLPCEYYVILRPYEARPWDMLYPRSAIPLFAFSRLKPQRLKRDKRRKAVGGLRDSAVVKLVVQTEMV